MALFSALAALALEHFRPLRPPLPHYRLFATLAGTVEARFNAGGFNPGAVGWAILMLPLLAAVWAVHAALSEFGSLFAWAWNVAVLYATLGFRYYSTDAEKIAAQLRAGDAAAAAASLAALRNGIADPAQTEVDCVRLTVEHVLLASLRQLFGPLLWFVLLSGFGPVGAVLYRGASILARRWESAAGQFGDFACRVFRWIDWLPARAVALTYAVAGNFEDATYAWRTQAERWPDSDDGVVLAAGAGALGVRLGGEVEVVGERVARPVLGDGETADVDWVDSALGLVWRGLTLWLVIGALIVVGGWAA